jgi:glutathione-specific gamma-glutamylcyclotransferase
MQSDDERRAVSLEPESPPPAVPVLRDPRLLLERTLAGWQDDQDLWVFGYASLIWRPEFEACERRLASVHGWHRSLRMRSRINRGSPERPGLVFALLPGGSCRGVAYRLARERVPTEIERLWAREMVTGVYDPRWLPCRTHAGPVRALAFTLGRDSPNHTGQLAEEELLAILRHARGRYGSTLEYLLDTERSLRAHGIRDRGIERQVALARRHGLAAARSERGGDD